MKWVVELQQFNFSFLVEESTRATLDDFLTHKERPLLIKKEVVMKPQVDMDEIGNAHLLFFDGLYRKSHDVALSGVVLHDP